MDNDLFDDGPDQTRILTDKGVFVFCLVLIAFVAIFHPWLWPL